MKAWPLFRKTSSSLWWSTVCRPGSLELTMNWTFFWRRSFNIPIYSMTCVSMKYYWNIKLKLKKYVYLSKAYLQKKNMNDPKERSLTHCGTKGQIMSKGHFGVFNSSKKRTKNFCPSRLGQEFKFSSSFLEELKTPKFPFEIN